MDGAETQFDSRTSSSLDGASASLLGPASFMLPLRVLPIHVPAPPCPAVPKSISVALLQLLADKLAGGR